MADEIKKIYHIDVGNISRKEVEDYINYVRELIKNPKTTVEELNNLGVTIETVNGDAPLEMTDDTYKGVL